jgi:hypothetical protein
MKRIDETGKRYGRLTVTGDSGIRYGKAGNVIWSCVCDCGKETMVGGDKLRAGKIRSCGCYRKEMMRERYSLPDGLAARKAVLRSLKFHARNRGYAYDLEDTFALNLMQQPCFYCGVPPSQIIQRGNSTGEFFYNGIDRVDNSRGYVADNVVSCCKYCNVAKQTRSVNKFLEWVRRVYEHSVLREGE